MNFERMTIRCESQLPNPHLEAPTVLTSYFEEHIIQDIVGEETLLSKHIFVLWCKQKTYLNMQKPPAKPT